MSRQHPSDTKGNEISDTQIRIEKGGPRGIGIVTFPDDLVMILPYNKGRASKKQPPLEQPSKHTSGLIIPPDKPIGAQTAHDTIRLYMTQGQAGQPIPAEINIPQCMRVRCETPVARLVELLALLLRPMGPGRVSLTCRDNQLEDDMALGVVMWTIWRSTKDMSLNFSFRPHTTPMQEEQPVEFKEGDRVIVKWRKRFYGAKVNEVKRKFSTPQGGTGTITSYVVHYDDASYETVVRGRVFHAAATGMVEPLTRREPASSTAERGRAIVGELVKVPQPSTALP